MSTENRERATAAPPEAVFVAAEDGLAAALGEAGLSAGEPEQGLVFSAAGKSPRTWGEVEPILLEAFELSKRAIAARAPIVYVVDGDALYGHAKPAAAALATGLLGGARSLAAEGVRHAIPVNAVSAGGGEDARTAAAVVTLLGGEGSGQLLHVDATHIGRPAV